MPILKAHPRGQIFMRYSWLYCDGGAVVLCKEPPDVLARTDNLGIPDARKQIRVVLSPEIETNPREFLFERQTS